LKVGTGAGAETNSFGSTTLILFSPHHHPEIIPIVVYGKIPTYLFPKLGKSSKFSSLSYLCTKALLSIFYNFSFRFLSIISSTLSPLELSHFHSFPILPLIIFFPFLNLREEGVLNLERKTPPLPLFTKPT
jgi:hypothetical protein